MEILALFILVFVGGVMLQRPFKARAEQHYDHALDLAAHGDHGGEAAHVGAGCAQSIVASLIGLLVLVAWFALAAATIPPR